MSTDDVGGGEHIERTSDGDWIKLNGSYNLQNIDSLTFRVANGSNDVAVGDPLATVEVRLDSVDGPLLTAAELTGTGGQSDWESQTFPITDPGGTHDIYLVFRGEGGGFRFTLVRLNWVEFGGQGVSAP